MMKVVRGIVFEIYPGYYATAQGKSQSEYIEYNKELILTEIS